MARNYKCKCQICGNKELTTAIAYKITKDGKNLYYCSKDEYDKWLADRNKVSKEKDEFYELVFEIIGHIDNSFLFKKVNELHAKYSYKLMSSYLYENVDYLSRVMNKQFVNTYAKIKYFTTILENNIVDYEIPIEDTIQNIEYEIVNTKYKSKRKRRSLLMIEQEVLDSIE